MAKITFFLLNAAFVTAILDIISWVRLASFDFKQENCVHFLVIVQVDRCSENDVRICMERSCEFVLSNIIGPGLLVAFVTHHSQSNHNAMTLRGGTQNILQTMPVNLKVHLPIEIRPSFTAKQNARTGNFSIMPTWRYHVTQFGLSSGSPSQNFWTAAVLRGRTYSSFVHFLTMMQIHPFAM